MNVADLKRELKARGLSCQGNKEKLRLRLAEALEEHDNVEPNDSVSQTGTRVTTSESLILRQADEAAARAGLLARLKALKEKQEIERQVSELKRREELIDLEAKISEVTAREEAIKRFQNQGMTGATVNECNVSQSSLRCPMSAVEPGVSRDELESASAVDGQPAMSANRVSFASDGGGGGSGHPEPENRKLAQERERTASLMRLPVIEMKKFGGDVTEFAQFMKCFELKIVSKLDCKQEKLYYLEQHMIPGSKPHAIVTSCMYLEDGYQQAIGMLNKRYGQPSNIAAAFMDRINSFNTIKANDVEALDRFALLLLSCKNALGSSSHMMGDPRTMRALTSKLPETMLNSWRRHADDIEERQGRDVKFEDVVKFVGDEARIAANPTYGRVMYCRDTSAVLPSRQGRTISSGVRHDRPLVAAVQTQNQAACLYCEAVGHVTANCDQLGDISSEQKKAFAMSKSLCFSCLRQGHMSANCRRRAKCRICERRHPTAMHLEGPRREGRDQGRPEVITDSRRHEAGPPREPVQPPQQRTGVTSATVCGTAGAGNLDRLMLPLVPVIICNGDIKIETFAFLDSGSTHSFATESLMDQLGIQRQPSRHLTITTVERDVSISTREAGGLHITDMYGGNKMELPKLFSMETIPADPNDYPKAEDVRRWDHLRDLELPEPEMSEVGLLLGANAFLAMEPMRVIPSVDGSPYAVLTRFGWVVSGLGSPSRSSHTTVCRTAVKDERASVEEMIRDMYDHEYEEKLHCTKRGISVEDKEWVKKIESSMEKHEGHYSAVLPTKTPEGRMPMNVKMAENRLEHLRSRLRKDTKLAEDYKKFMDEMINNGFAEEVPEEEQRRADGRVWYLPHHAVYHPTKPDKIRVVFDCAARYNGVSLNDILLTGPDQTNSLVDVLLRFRLERVAFTADVEGMFNQVKVHEADRDLIRFLWFENGNISGRARHYRMTVHLFGATSSPSVACYALRKTAADAGDDFSQECTTTVIENFYVDDVLQSAPTDEEAITLAHELKDLCKRGGFNLTKFASNSQVVMEAIGNEDRSAEMKKWSSPLDELPTERTLGVIWCPEYDLLKLSPQVKSVKAKICSRRGLLSLVSSLYDPLGMAEPMVIQGRRLLQELTRKQMDWDAELDEEDRLAWTGWLSSLEGLDSLSISRCIKPKDFDSVTICQMHTFVDASEAAYGAVSYIRLTDMTGAVHVSFLKGKAHLAPLKVISIPRLELMAAVTGVRLNALISDALKIQLERSSVEIEEFFWTDSTTVLRYINNRKTRFHTFVANRLAIIHDGSHPAQWRHVPSSQNPADDVSRGTQSDRWLSGPEYLWENRQCWPKTPEALHDRLDDLEVKKMTVCAAKTSDATPENEFQNPLQKLMVHYRDRHRLLRAVAWIMKVKQELIRRVKQEGAATQKKAILLETQDIREAERAILISIQAAAFPEEVDALNSGKDIRATSKLTRFSPFIEDGIIRVGGRLQHSFLEYDVKHPVILPNHVKYVKLLVEDVHRRTGHAGQQHVLAELRKNFWILRGTSAVKGVLRSCIVCRRLRAKTEKQKMADLPGDRIRSGGRPFTRTGVDYFGPFYVSQGRGQAKRYGVIFTCLSVRCIHIEVAEDLSSDSFICALKRFVARRGHVKTLRSDRATNFVGAHRELSEELKRLEEKEEWISREMLANNIDWKFNTPGASHHGGAWERMIRTVRRILDTMLHARTLKNETLQTFLCEAEAIVNSRPLVPPSSDPLDAPPLSPNDILLLEAGSEATLLNTFTGSDKDHRKMWKHASYMADVFWRRWRREYAPLLQQRPVSTARARQNLAVGDLVLMVDDSVPRGQWPIGRVESVKMSKDGLVRSVSLNIRGVTVERPITKLVKMS